MTFGLSGTALAGLAVGGATLYSANKSAGAAEDAANLQSASSDKAIAAQNDRFAAIQKLLAPFVEGGTKAFGQQLDLAGVNGAGPQQASLATLQDSPIFQALVKQGETGILSNASATGGLRGGNVQGALEEFRPNMLSALIDQQFQRLGGLSTTGQNAAAGVGTAGQNSTNAITQLLQQQGAAQAGGALAQGRSFASIPNALTGGLGIFTGLGGKF